MRILHVYRHCLDEGGVPHLTRRLIGAQAARGHEILVVSADRKGPRIYPGGENDHIHYFQTSSRPTSLRRLEGAVRDFGPDIAHISGLTIPSQQFWARRITRSRRLPYVVSPHGVLNSFGMNVRFGAKRRYRHRIVAKKLFRRFADLPLLREAAAIHAECAFEADLALAAGARRVFALPIGIDDEWRNASIAEGHELHVPATFLHLGRFDMVQKGIDLILEASGTLAATHSARGWRVILAGSPVGKSIAVIRDTIRKHQLEANIEVRDPVWASREKEALWREADFFFSVHRYGGMPRATAEALGNGVPILASRESNWGDWVQSEKLGAVAELTAESVAQAMNRLMTAPSDGFRPMALRAFRFAEAHSWDRVAHAFAVEYERVLS